jgi:hypothetical protein
MATYVFPKIGHMSVADIRAGEIVDVLRPIWATKPETARRILQRLEFVFRAAIRREWRERASPTIGVREELGSMRKVEKHFLNCSCSRAGPTHRTGFSVSCGGPMTNESRPSNAEDRLLASRADRTMENEKRTIKLWRLNENNRKQFAGTIEPAELIVKWSAFLVTAERGVHFATYRGSFVGPWPALESDARALAP